MNKLTLAMITFASSVALAQGAGSGAAKAPEAKKADAPKADAKAAPPADAKKAAEAMKMKAPPEVAEMAKSVVGTWKCTGTLINPMDGSTMPAKMTMVNKVDADKAWITSTLSGLPNKMSMMATYDANSKKWYRIITDSTGGSDVSWAASPAGGKMVWEGEGRGMNMKPWKTKITEETVSPKEVKMMGEYAIDGKTYAKTWEAVCKK
jgi:hypothetical protein